MTVRRPSFALLLLAPGVIALLVEPAVWLARTWVEPSYDSLGGLVALLCLGLVVRSVSSGPARAGGSHRGALALLLVAAAIRLAGRLLDISHVGALALVCDVYALGHLLGLHRRPWALRPVALAGLFGLSLPVEQALQHLFAYPLRWVAAVWAEVLVRPLAPDVVREGTLLIQPGTVLSVDLPCSGAQGLFLFSVLALSLLCRRRVGVVGWGLAGAAALGGALLSNTLRIAILFVGPTETLLAEPWHSAVGLVAMGLGVVPLVALAVRWPDLSPVPGQTRPWVIPVSEGLQRRLALGGALVFTALALLIARAPHRPVDVSDTVVGVTLPVHLGDALGMALVPTDKERLYYERYGGELAKRAYTRPSGATHSVMLVRTTAPLRHLHRPEDCLRGAGHTVTRLGIRPGAVPTTVWKTVDLDGQVWRVETSLVSADGQTAETVSEAIWRWSRDPGSTWMLVERIRPWSLCEAQPAECESFDNTLFTVLDLEPEEA